MSLKEESSKEYQHISLTRKNFVAEIVNQEYIFTLRERPVKGTQKYPCSLRISAAALESAVFFSGVKKTSSFVASLQTAGDFAAERAAFREIATRADRSVCLRWLTAVGQRSRLAVSFSRVETSFGGYNPPRSRDESLTRVSWSVGHARLTKFSLFIRVMDVSTM